MSALLPPEEMSALVPPEDECLCALRPDAGSGCRHLAPLYAALESEASLHPSLAQAFFSYHDRLANRRARLILAAKGTVLFFSLNALDVILAGI